VSTGNWVGGRVVCDYAISHFGHVFPFRRWNSERCYSGLGQPWRRGRAVGYAALVRRVPRVWGRQISELETGDDRSRRSDVLDRNRLLRACGGHTGWAGIFSADRGRGFLGGCKGLSRLAPFSSLWGLLRG